CLRRRDATAPAGKSESAPDPAASVPLETILYSQGVPATSPTGAEIAARGATSSPGGFPGPACSQGARTPSGTPRIPDDETRCAGTQLSLRGRSRLAQSKAANRSARPPATQSPGAEAGMPRLQARRS